MLIVAEHTILDCYRPDWQTYQLLVTQHYVIETVQGKLIEPNIPHCAALILPSLDLCDDENSEKWKNTLPEILISCIVNCVLSL